MALFHTIFPSQPLRFVIRSGLLVLFEDVMTHTGELAILNQSVEGGEFHSLDDTPFKINHAHCPADLSPSNSIVGDHSESARPASRRQEGRR